MSNFVEWASYYLEAGLSVIPIRTDTTKAPALTAWKPFQSVPATIEQVNLWAKGEPGIAIVTGSVSGIEVIDFDYTICWDAFTELAKETGLWDIVVPMVKVRTPRPGMHLYYRLAPGTTIPGNHDLAARMVKTDDGASERRHATIQTRGEGGYVLAPGCPPTCHPSGNLYEIVDGDMTAIGLLSADNRAELHNLCRALTEVHDEIAPVGLPRQPSAPRLEGEGLKPGEDYAQRGDHLALLEREGWKPVAKRGDTVHYRRPGKKEGISATWNHDGHGTFYVFSSNAHPFEPNRSYTPFAIYTIYEHKGDYAAAATKLGAMGYGAPPLTKGTRMQRSGPAKVATAMQDASGQALIDGENVGDEDIDLALRWAQMVKHRWAYVEGDQWWQCDGRSWTYASAEAATSELQAWMLELRCAGSALKINRTKVSGVLYLAKSFLGPVPVAKFDSNPNWIPVLNGVYDIATGQIKPHSPDNLITRVAPYIYDPDAECPRWRKFLTEVLIEKDGSACHEWHTALQLWFGYCLTADSSLQTSMIWVGEGSNGKGVATRVLSALVGRKSTTSVPIDMLHDPYHRAELHGKLLGLVDEPDPRSMTKNGNWFKAIVGGDEISARRPTEKVFNFAPKCRIVVSCNEMPKTRDLSHGYFRRLIIIEFRNNIPAENRDRTLDETLGQEMPGIFNWALEGLLRLKSDSTLFIDPPSSRALVEEYKRDQDPIQRWIDESYKRGASEEDRIPANDLYDAYKLWAEKNNEWKSTGRLFALRLSKMGYDTRAFRVVGIDGVARIAKCRFPIKPISADEV